LPTMARPVEFREAPLAWAARELAALHGASLGYAFILAVCVIWVGGSFLVESLAGTSVCFVRMCTCIPTLAAFSFLAGHPFPDSSVRS
jgi:hypothetical protein